MWIELTDKIVDKILPMVNNGTANDPLQLFAAIEEVLRTFDNERITRVYIKIPPPEMIAQIYEKSRKRLLEKLSMDEKPQTLSSGKAINE